MIHVGKTPVRLDDLDRRRELTVLDLLSRIETRVRQGGTEENIQGVIDGVLGTWKRFVTGFRVGAPQGRHGKTLFVECRTSLPWAEQYRFAQAITAQLTKLGIRQVRFA